MTRPAPTRREFLIKVSSVSAVIAAGGVLSACGGGGGGGGDDDAPVAVDARMVRFDYGVASGDPQDDRVILWTHARYADSGDDVPLRFEMALDAGFGNILAAGDAAATAATGHTVKVDAAGLSAGIEYYYRFRSGRWVSGVGRTRTLPEATTTEVKFAVFSCANYPAGFFQVYGEGARSDAQYAIHLGDYIYEDGVDGYASQQAAQLGRLSDPTSEIITLDDYRRRYAQYRSDPDLMNVHARMPMIAVWDDHEVANDAWKDGAENHTEGAEGPYAARRAAAQQAWHEWLPIRTGADRARIWRSFQFGQLVALHMLDARLAARDRQVTFEELLDPQTAAAARATLASPTRQMLGAEQSSFLLQQMAASTATWQVLGQQVLMARLELPGSVLQALLANASADSFEDAVADYLVARATPEASRTAAQNALLDSSLNPKLGYNLDAWDGYPVARETLLASIAQMNKRLVVLAGDTHNAWHSDLTLAGLIDPAQANLKVGEEFATSSVSSPGFESVVPLPGAQLKRLFESVFDDLKWLDPSRRGYLKMTFTPSAARADWIFVDTVVSRAYQVAAPETRIFGV
ncbi:MAG TPA: alkaline phosphatase D family protein [Ramlibacter sp.]|nr:alkaline phosphatase D family protein [Ramlibacter sp.]